MAGPMAGQTAAAPLAQRRRGIRWRRWLGLSLPGAIALAVLVAGVGANVLATHDPEFINLGERLQPPIFDGGAWDHVLGTDHVGRDIFSRLLHGARISLIVVVASWCRARRCSGRCWGCSRAGWAASPASC